MKKSFLFIIIILFTLPLFSHAEIIPIPEDQKVMEEVDEKYYLSDSLYEDPSLQVKISEGRMFETNYLAIRVTIADPSQIRSYVHPAKGGAYGDRMAKIVHAVLAITGDSFYTNKSGDTRKYEVRQGKTVLNQKWRDRNYFDVLMIDRSGDFHVLKEPSLDELQDYIETHSVLNTFYFGPALVVNGETQPFPTGQKANGVGWAKPAQRLCLCQMAPLEYMIISTGGPDHPNCKGITGEELVQIILAEGQPQVAYNLDGGTAAWVVFRNKKINLFGRGISGGKKAVNDLIFFASAWQDNNP